MREEKNILFYAGRVLRSLTRKRLICRFSRKSSNWTCLRTTCSTCFTPSRPSTFPGRPDRARKSTICSDSLCSTTIPSSSTLFFASSVTVAHKSFEYSMILDILRLCILVSQFCWFFSNLEIILGYWVGIILQSDLSKLDPQKLSYREKKDHVSFFSHKSYTIFCGSSLEKSVLSCIQIFSWKFHYEEKWKITHKRVNVHTRGFKMYKFDHRLFQTFVRHCILFPLAVRIWSPLNAIHFCIATSGSPVFWQVRWTTMCVPLCGRCTSRRATLFSFSTWLSSCSSMQGINFSLFHIQTGSFLFLGFNSIFTIFDKE